MEVRWTMCSSNRDRVFWSQGLTVEVDGLGFSCLGTKSSCLRDQVLLPQGLTVEMLWILEAYIS